MRHIPNLERDNNQQRLIAGAYNNLFEIAKQYEEPITNNSSSEEIEFVSFEQALKELVALKKS